MVLFAIEEIEKIVFSCDGNKAPGADKFSMAFFQENWDLIKGDLRESLRNF